MTKPTLSIVVNCARESFSLPDHPKTHLFGLLLREIAKQRDVTVPIELVVADTEYDTRRDWFEWRSRHHGGLPCPVKHVPVRGYWADHDCCNISHAKNQSVIHAEGEWIITWDDGTVFEAHYLSAVLAHFARAVFPCAIYDYSYCRTPERIDCRVEGHEVSRVLERDGVVFSDQTPARWQRREWPVHGYGFVGFLAAAFYEVGGYEELFDGGRGQEDIEYSLRLLRAGHRLCYDTRIRAFILDQGPVAPRFAANPEWIVHCASALAPLLYEQIATGRRTTANRAPLDSVSLRSIYPRCQHYVPDERRDRVRLVCPSCGHAMTVHPSSAPKDPRCPRCSRGSGGPVALAEDLSARLEGRGKCALYMAPGDALRGICPFVSRDADGHPLADFTDRQGSHDLYRAFLDTPELFQRDLRAEHEALVGTPISEIDGTYVGVDWRS